MTDAVVLIPFVGMSKWLDRCTAYCARQGYTVIAVATELDDGLRLLRAQPGRKLIIVSLEMFGDVEIATASGAISVAQPDDPRVPTRRRPNMRTGEAESRRPAGMVA